VDALSGDIEPVGNIGDSTCFVEEPAYSECRWREEIGPLYMAKFSSFEVEPPASRSERQ